MKLNNLTSSNAFTGILIGIGIVVAAGIIFYAGERVGFHKARYSFDWGERYYRSVAGPRKGMMGGNFDRDDFVRGHGIVGSILSINDGSWVIQDRDGTEKTVRITEKTAIKRFRDTISTADVKVGEVVAVIGKPNTAGEVEAQLVRVMPMMPQSAPQENTAPQSNVN